MTSPDYKLRVEGSLFINNSLTDKITNTAWTNPSDQRLKDVTGDFKHGLDKLNQLRPIREHFKAGNPYNAPTEEDHNGWRRNSTLESRKKGKCVR